MSQISRVFAAPNDKIGRKIHKREDLIPILVGCCWSRARPECGETLPRAGPYRRKTEAARWPDEHVNLDLPRRKT